MKQKIMKQKTETRYGDALLRWTLYAIAGSIGLHLLGQFVVRVIGTDSIFIDELVWRFNVDLELNVPTWFSSFLAATAALIALFIAGRYAKRKSNRPLRNVWALIGAVLLLIAVDEVSSLHELALQFIHIQVGFGEAQTYAANAWLIIMPLIAAGFLFAIWLMYRRLERGTFIRLAAAVSVYLLGAVVVEYISIPVSDATHLYNFLLAPLEEGLEMLGLWLVLRASLLHIRDYLPNTHKRLMEVWR